MRTRMVDAYASELRRILSDTLGAEDVEEIVSEAKSHLCERADDLRSLGMSAFDADWQAAEDFGNIQEIAVELARGYPPKRPIETSRVRWLPELGLAAMLLCAGYAYHIYGGMRGVEEACASTNSAMAMLVVPGMFSALGRLKYSRQRACAIQIRMANYAVAMSLFQALCFGYLQISGQAILLNLYPMRYLFCAATVLMYVVMCNAGAISRIGSRIRERSRMR